MAKTNLSLEGLLLFFLLLFSLLEIRGDDKDASFPYEAPEPYEMLHDFCTDCNPTVEMSPDPLVSMTWSPNVNESKLQIYRIFHPVKFKVSPPDAIQGIESFFKNSNESSLSLTISKNCSLMLDWGVERAAWLELTSPDDLSSTNAAISEFNMPYPGKTKPLVRYGNHTYRLETNDQLYEGVRFTWLYFNFSSIQDIKLPIEIKNISLVAKIKPINYTGFFRSSSDELTKAWYTGAYGVRLNMDENFFNSILIERGDRVAIQGDGHPTMDAALVAFSSYDLISKVLNQTDSADHNVVDAGIMAYPLYWSLSAIDFFLASGDKDTFQSLVPDIMKIVDARINDFLEPDLDITWFGWDDRIGNGWCFHSKHMNCPREAHLAFAGLLVRVCKDFQHSLFLANMPLQAQKYKKTFQSLGQRLVSVPEWPHGLGVHAAANAINSGIASLQDVEFWMTSVLNDPVTICSFSQFNQYWILQALGNAGYMEHALASIKMCWGAAMKLGKGCFWEQYSLEWIKFMKDGDVAPTMPSYCHPWSSGVTAWLSHVLGGIQPLLPGYIEFLAAPYVSMQYPSVSTTVGTPHGKLHVNATLQNTGSLTEYNAKVQSPVDGYFGIQKSITASGEDSRRGDLKHVLLNRKPVNLLTATDIKRVIDGSNESLLNISESFLFVRIQSRIDTSISAAYYPTQNKHHYDMELSDYPPFPKPFYPATVIGIDKNSQGDGLYKYGRSGYILLGVNNGTDMTSVPRFIHNVSIKQHSYPGWLNVKREYIGASRESKSYLPIQSSRSKQTERALGMVGQDGIGGYCPDLNSILIDVQKATGIETKISISLYFVAKSKADKFAIRVMDLKSLNVIAPTTVIEDYTRGIWWTMEYTKSVRFRLMNMQGLHLSAIGFLSERADSIY